MENLLSEYLKCRPQRLCHMCGKCCRVVTTAKSYEELCACRDQGDEGAIDFLEIFEPYPSVEAAREVSPETVYNVVGALKENGIYDEKALTFYKCRHLQADNLCSRYKDRPDLCEVFPSSPWAVVPPGCGFEGWLFQQREGKKQKIRKMKEDILSLEVMLKESNDLEQMKKILKVIEEVKKTINMYAKYGSGDW